ncbi:MAG: O-antigen ligase domain-containing protein, partial [Bacteroidales bacterium]
ILVSLFTFFKFTTIGESNQYIRRTRTTFNTEEDASFNIRKINQAKIKVHMKDKPFGIGIGLSAGRANKYGSYTELSRIPTDSWLVLIWVETGIIGLILYLSVLLFIMAYCGYIIMFKLKNNELRHYMIGLFGGIAGMIVASYANEAFAQFPNGYIIFIGLGLISVSPYFDKEIEERQQKLEKIVENENEISNFIEHVELKD